MKKHLIKIFSINFIGAIINFLSTILIIRLFGLEIFGQFAVISAYVGLFTLIYIIIPPSYAVFKIQDDDEFGKILFLNYLIASFLVGVIIFISNFFIVYNADIKLIILFAISIGFMNYFDVYLKAFNKLDRYYFVLFIFYCVKTVILIVLFIVECDYALNILIEINVFSYIVAMSFGFIKYIKVNNIINISFSLISKYFLFLKNNFNILKHYYLNIILKRLKDNAITIILTQIVSNEIIGIYSLFVKVGMFVLGQARVVEAFFMNRNNLDKISLMENKKILLGLMLQLLILMLGLIYIKLSTNKFMFFELFIYSFLSYPYIYLIILRNKMLSLYQVKYLNYMYIFYLSELLFFYIFSRYYCINTIIAVLCFVVITDYTNVFYLNMINKVKNENRSVD